MNKLNKQADCRLQYNFHTVLLSLYVADPATFLASNGVPGTFPSAS